MNTPFVADRLDIWLVTLTATLTDGSVVTKIAKYRGDPRLPDAELLEGEDLAAGATVTCNSGAAVNVANQPGPTVVLDHL